MGKALMNTTSIEDDDVASAGVAVSPSLYRPPPPPLSLSLPLPCLTLPLAACCLCLCVCIKSAVQSRQKRRQRTHWLTLIFPSSLASSPILLPCCVAATSDALTAHAQRVASCLICRFQGNAATRLLLRLCCRCFSPCYLLAARLLFFPRPLPSFLVSCMQLSSVSLQFMLAAPISIRIPIPMPRSHSRCHFHYHFPVPCSLLPLPCRVPCGPQLNYSSN